MSDGRLWVYGTNLINKTGIGGARKGAGTAVSCFSTADPTSGSGWRAGEALVLPAGYSVFNTDVAPVRFLTVFSLILIVFHCFSLCFTAFFHSLSLFFIDTGE